MVADGNEGNGGRGGESSISLPPSTGRSLSARMSTPQGRALPEVAASMGLILAALVEAAAPLGNGALLRQCCARRDWCDAHLVHLCAVDLLAAAPSCRLGLLAASAAGVGRVRPGPLHPAARRSSRVRCCLPASLPGVAPGLALPPHSSSAMARRGLRPA